MKKPALAGRIAQLVEQLTLNQRVPGSSPGASTNIFNGLAPPLKGHRLRKTGIKTVVSPAIPLYVHPPFSYAVVTEKMEMAGHGNGDFGA